MKLEEYKKLIGTMTPETFTKIGADILKNLQEDDAERSSYAAKIADLEKKNRELQDTNQNLFLRVTGSSDVHDDEDTPEKALKDILDNI